MLGERIKALRMAKQLDQEELSQELGITKQSISNWENNNIHPSIDKLIKLADFFDVTTDYLLERDRPGAMLDTAGLTYDEIGHMQTVINDILKYREKG